MSDLGWRAEGIERARAAGGLELERYRRPGFVSGCAIRRSLAEASAAGVPVDTEWSVELDPTPEDYRRTRGQDG